MTKESAAEIILNLINAAEADKREFTISEIRALKKAYVAMNSESATNADRIRAMTDEELAEWLYCPGLAKDMFPNHEFFIAPSYEDWLAWLRQEVKQNDNP